MRRILGFVLIGAIPLGAAVGCLALVTMNSARMIGQRPELLPNAANGRIGAIEPDSQGRWTVQVLADIQDGFPYIPQILREGERHGARAVVIAGDLATGDGGEHLKLLLQKLRAYPGHVPLFAVPGNHDAISATDCDHFNAAFGGSEFEFRIGSTWFVGVDSNSADSRRSARQRIAERVDSATTSGEHVVVVSHHSPLNIARDGSDGDPSEVDHKLLDILRQPSVAYVISGHVHRERFDRIGSTRFVIAPPSGDKSEGQGQTAVSYLLLSWTGEHFVLERHRFARQNSKELEATVRDDLFAHAQPWLHSLFARGARAPQAVGAGSRNF